MTRRNIFYALSLIPKLVARARGSCIRMLIIAAGGKCQRGLRIEAGFRLRQGFHSGLDFGRDVYLGRYTTIDCPPGATLRIGTNTTFTQGCFVGARSAIDVGENTLVGEYCSLRDANHNTDDADLLIVDQAMTAQPIWIARNVWIGRGCAILAGAAVGEGAVIGANSVVTGSIESYQIAVGCPARSIRLRKTSK